MWQRCLFFSMVSLLLLFLSGCANNLGQKKEIFQLAQVHNQASKRVIAQDLPSHYLVLNYQKNQTDLSVPQQKTISNALGHMSHLSDYRVLVLAAPEIVEKSDNSKQVMQIETVAQRLHRVEGFIRQSSKMKVALVYDRALPENTLHIEFRPDAKVS